MKTEETLNNKLNRVLEYYKLVEPADVAILSYLKKNEYYILKTILKQVGKYSIWISIIYFFLKKLSRYGIKATYTNAVIALATTSVVTCAGVFGAYQGVTALIDNLKSPKNNTENISNKNNLEIVDNHNKKNAILTPVMKKTKPQKPLVKTITTHPAIGIRELTTSIPGISKKNITRRFLNLLPQKKFRLLQSYNNNNNFLTHFVDLMLIKTKNEYILRIKAASEKTGSYKYINEYKFADLNTLDTVLIQAAKELTNKKL